MKVPFIPGLIAVFTITMFAAEAYAACNYPSDRDSMGRRCGGRAASVIPGGKLGGDGRYNDSYGRQRQYGKGNDPYDRPQRGLGNSNLGNSNSRGFGGTHNNLGSGNSYNPFK